MPIDAYELLQTLVEHYRYHPVVRPRHLLLIEPPEQLPTLQTDSPLVGRVLGNLIKNVLEATRAGNTDEVSVCGRNGGQCVQFIVWNPEPIPAELQKSFPPCFLP